MTRPEEEPGPEQPERAPWGNAPKLATALALFFVAGWLAFSSWERARVDWILGDLARGEPGAREALRSLGERALPHLERELASPEPGERFFAILALGEIPGEGASALLVRAGRHGDPFTAANAVARLGARKGPEVVAALAERLDDRRPEVRRVARSALATRTGIPWWAFGRATDF